MDGCICRPARRDQDARKTEGPPPRGRAFGRALGRSGPTLVTIYIYMQPVIAALLAWAQLGQPLTPRLVTAAAFIVAGVAIVVSRPITALPSR